MNELENPLLRLIDRGQSYWLDNLTRGKIQSGELERRVTSEGLRGLTSNPSIFHKAVSGSGDYADVIDKGAKSGKSPYEIYESLVLADIRDACEVLRPVYDESEGLDGYVSLELSPYLAHDTEGSMRDARRLFQEVDRPNLLIKIPGTPAGVPAIEQMLYEGVNVNVTLLFSIERYEAVADAYLRALERRLDKGKSVDDVASVASLFLSRIDALVDQLLGHRIRTGESASPGDEDAAVAPEHLMGKAAIANAKLAYRSLSKLLETDRWKRLAAAGARPQRLLWASTSTKDPLYSDVRYVEPLIGAHTVNTLPDETIAAFADHGVVDDTVANGVEEAQRTFEALEKAGVDFGAVTEQLMNEGVQKFMDSFDALLTTIAEERDRCLRVGGRPEPSSFGETKSRIDDVVASLAARQFTRRLHDKDASLWTRDPEKAAEVRNRLGWVTAPTDFLERVDEIRAFAHEVREDGFSHVVLLGMGGSSLAPQVSAETFGSIDGWPTITVLDDTDPDAVREVRERVPEDRTFFLVSSKSGTTLETLSLYHRFYEWMKERHGDQAGDRFAAVTDPGTPLAGEARQRGFRRVFENPGDFGGRYSALSYFGLVPMALQGVDIANVLVRARNMQMGCAAHLPETANPGIRLGAALGGLCTAGRDKVTFVTSERLKAFGAWAEQLLAESTGKGGTGLVPVDGEHTGPPEVYAEDRVFVHLRTVLESDPVNTRRLEVLEQAGHPVIRIVVGDILDLGAEYYRWEMAVATAGAVMGIDAFDQPDVESAKARTRELLERWEDDGLPSPGDPAAEDERLSLYLPDEVPTHGQPTEVIDSYLRGARAGDYLAVLAWMPRAAASEEPLAELRRTVRDRFGIATTLGWGPRYLHSIGQLHKGGANTGVFLVLTCDESEDLAIPDRPFGFSTLHHAQALGDIRALRDVRRKVVRVHLKGEPATALEHLVGALNARVGGATAEVR